MIYVFLVFSILPKNEQNYSIWGTIALKSNFFVRFLGEFKIPKKHFEIIWPLVAILQKTIFQFST